MRHWQKKNVETQVEDALVVVPLCPALDIPLAEVGELPPRHLEGEGLAAPKETIGCLALVDHGLHISHVYPQALIPLPSNPLPFDVPASFLFHGRP